ncbi:RNA binding protein, heterogenous nuclear RNP-K like protein [Yamadazyma tenuis]|uniref:K Homology domain-containing protein n=1 Tax=Candida tenuis (strain ATCC 10573 / BCRC 21748 / CBS 615 / JCM 9827 / NBRC 10315 / NRRL Y-1498 / VKM Y-70) TaxID=590646 RepID=G3B490_CANTC|nr:uncharacterized protein CANTEDRAFT_104592 [Yamadazyma tenuis ATCC 10573]EGV63923.1 hypothetical protein CANTEDRAFT_104592 [Yamadazyma tenuis ATCC 10573]WEJ96459.1 RNA binding protein, heterogenous nuclear RNP-K like protein [Yamadazyma tenuis]
MTESLFESFESPATSPLSSQGSTQSHSGAPLWNDAGTAAETNTSTTVITTSTTMGAPLQPPSPSRESPADVPDNDSYPGTQDEILPPVSPENGNALINYRLLISSKESGCLIGQSGSVINSIRQETDTKAGISKLLAHTQERILTVSGTLDNCSKAISYFSQALIEAQQHEADAASTASAGPMPSSVEEYPHFPLRQLSIHKNIAGHSTVLRLLIPNSQMGTIIGAKGARIQRIQQVFGVSMIASKSFLPGSNERLVELQGSVPELYAALRVISRCLIEDFGGVVGTSYYVPRPRRPDVPVVAPLPVSAPAAPGTGPASDSSSSPARLVTTSMAFSKDIVGALIGKSGSRIQGVRKISGAIIGISDELEGSSERIFTISGSTYAVDKAKALLKHNLEREQQRREGVRR